MPRSPSTIKQDQKSPRIKKSPKRTPKVEDEVSEQPHSVVPSTSRGTIRQFLAPPSYPDQIKQDQKSPRIKKSPKRTPKVEDEVSEQPHSVVPSTSRGTIRQFLAPPSYPDQIKQDQKSPRIKKSPKRTPKVEDEVSEQPHSVVPSTSRGTIRQFLAPPSYPDQIKQDQKSPRIKKSPKRTPKVEDEVSEQPHSVVPSTSRGTIRQFLAPPSYPDQIKQDQKSPRIKKSPKRTPKVEDEVSEQPHSVVPSTSRGTIRQFLAPPSYPDQIKPETKSPRIKKSPRRSPKVEDEVSEQPHLGVPSTSDGTIRQFLAPPSYPKQVVYVKKHVWETELRKLNRLREELSNLLEDVDESTLPDDERGERLIDRLSLEAEVRHQVDKVGNMVVEPDKPTAEDTDKDGFDEGMGYAFLPARMFGTQSMADDMAERLLILDRLRDLHESLATRPSETELATVPAALKSELMPHQRHALAWLLWRETQRPCGGILADDMGLGKTITMIALLMADKESNIGNDDDEDDEPINSNVEVSGGTLVVCPASLMEQWAGEVQNHCRPHAALVCLHHGAARTHQPHQLAANDLVITTYNILQRDHEKNGVLMRVCWRRVILDEAHIVRNHKSATSLAVAALSAKRHWCLTGTPIHNTDMDLFPLFKFLRITPFTDLPMWKKWIENKDAGGQMRLGTIMCCILLRRTKSQLQHSGQLACLPTRTVHQVPITLTSNEMDVYQEVLVLSKTLIEHFLDQRDEELADSEEYLPPENDTTYAKMHEKMIARQGAKPVKSQEIMVLLLRLRQICCHCGLIATMLDPADDDAGARDVDDDPAGQHLVAELNKLTLEESPSKRKSYNIFEEDPEEGTSVAEAIRSVISANNPVFDLSSPSSKITAVIDCLKLNVLANEGEKAVVVSQWTSVLRLVEQQLKEMRVRFVTLSGNVPVSARPKLVNAINDPNSNVKVMLLSLCAGGVGLNLCGANHLLLLDPHWNPQLEKQAQDRVYRMGQTRPVHIYRFICLDTVEQSIRRLQEAKLDLADSVLTGTHYTYACKLSIKDLKLLFNI